MMATSIKIIIIWLLLIPVSLLVFAPRASAFDLFGDPCSKPDASSSPVCQDKTTQQKSSTNPVVDTIKKVANVIVIIAGVAAVITIIVSGFMFITAGGSISGQRSGDNPAKAAKAKSALSAALVGLVIVALAWTIVTFVTDKFIHS